MSDYRVKITVRNARILRAIEDAGFESQAACARAIGCSLTALNSLVAMRTPAVNKNGRLSTLAQLLVDELCLLPEDLWTQDQLFMDLERNTSETEVNETEVQAIRDESAKLARKMLEGLPSNDRRVLEGRFLKDETLDEISSTAGRDGGKVMRERVRQIESRALRRLLWKSMQPGEAGREDF
tara:strand:- start:96 stop:641 length:546 start_codon:yes stop_codon:yes gene_type:complete